jgi:hypothetical protein
MPFRFSYYAPNYSACLSEMCGFSSLFSPNIATRIIDFLDIVQLRFVVGFICLTFNMLLEYVDANTTATSTTTTTTTMTTITTISDVAVCGFTHWYYRHQTLNKSEVY